MSNEKTFDILIKQAERMERKIDQLDAKITEMKLKDAKWHGRYLLIVFVIGAAGGKSWEFVKKLIG